MHTCEQCHRNFSSSKNLNIHRSRSHRASSQQHQQNQQLHHQNGEESQSQPAYAIHRGRRPVVGLNVSNDMMVPVVDGGDSANETIGEAVAEQTANVDTVEEASTINNGVFNKEPPVN